jgi:hypothetical protein
MPTRANCWRNPILKVFLGSPLMRAGTDFMPR